MGKNKNVPESDGESFSSSDIAESYLSGRREGLKAIELYLDNEKDKDFDQEELDFKGKEYSIKPQIKKKESSFSKYLAPIVSVGVGGVLAGMLLVNSGSLGKLEKSILPGQTFSTSSRIIDDVNLYNMKLTDGGSIEFYQAGEKKGVIAPKDYVAAVVDLLDKKDPQAILNTWPTYDDAAKALDFSAAPRQAQYGFNADVKGLKEVFKTNVYGGQ